MTDSAERLRPDLLALSETDRAELFNLLGESLEPAQPEAEERAVGEGNGGGTPRRFMRLAGSVQGAPDLSARRGFSKGGG